MLDPRRLKPAALVRLLNSTPRGTVIGTRQLRRHRERAGYAIGDDHTVDLFRYAAWLTLEYLRPPEERQSYEEAKRRQSERNAERVAAAQDIGEIPAVADPERRAAAEQSLLCFCETYFREVFYLPWSPDHLLVIERLERVVRHGGLFAVAMPRGSGKTLVCQMAVLWAALTAATPFVCLIAASAKMAVELMEKFKVWLETNVPLGEDFREVCYPIPKLERITNRQRGQKHNGEPTRIEWVSEKIVLPTIAGSKASGVVISCSGMEGSHSRGQNHARPDGNVVRPTVFYRQHRAEMDSGAAIAWPERFNPDELSAIQHAMDLKLRDEAAFFAEYQNQPLVPDEESGLLTAAEIAAKTNGRTRGDIPAETPRLRAAYLTMFIDVQQKALYWTLVAWEPNFTGYVVDYGTWPDQRRSYFTLRDFTATIARAIRNANLEGQVYGALDKLTGERLGGGRCVRRPTAARTGPRCGSTAASSTPTGARPPTSIVGAGPRARPSAEPVRRRAAAQPRADTGGRGVRADATSAGAGPHALQRIPAEARRPGGPALDHPCPHRPHGAAYPHRHQLLEIVRLCAARRGDGRPGLPVALRPRLGRPPAHRRAHHRRDVREGVGPGAGR